MPSNIDAQHSHVQIYFPDAQKPSDLEFAKPVSLYASPNNPGACAAAETIGDAIYSGEHPNELFTGISSIFVSLAMYMYIYTYMYMCMYICVNPGRLRRR